MDDVKPAASSTLSQQVQKLMKKLFVATAPVSCNYNVAFINLVEGCELGAEKDINGKAVFVLTNLSCNAQRDQNTDK